jgi:hypothetical protein
MNRSTLRLLVTFVTTLVLVALLADVADAQRRRRRRRRPEPEPTEQPAEDAAEGEGEGEGEDPDAGAEGEPDAAAEGEAEPTDLADEVPAEEEPLEPELEDLSPLRSDLATLMDELVQVRSRIAVLGRQLFETKVQLRVENRAGDEQIVSRLVLRLDGDPVHRSEEDPGDDAAKLFEGFAAPGPHELTVEVEMRSRANEEYRYLSSDRFRFQVVRGKLTEVIVTLDDDSDIAEDFEDDGEGEYDVSTRVRVATRELGEEDD